MGKPAAGNILLMTLLFLLLSTILVALSVRLGLGHMRIVRNDQAHAEAMDAAQMVLDRVISKPASAVADPLANPGSYPQTQTVDIDQDGTADFTVVVSRPRCLGVHDTAYSVGNSYTMAPAKAMLWEFTVTATSTQTGASVEIHQGVQVVPDDYICS